MTQSSSGLTGLLKRVEGAEGGSRELFLILAEAMMPDYKSALDWRSAFNSFVGVEAWESAALALCSRVLPGWCRSVVDLTPELCEGYVWERFSTGNIQGKAKTPALALVAAILRALIVQALAVEGGEDRSSVAQSGSALHGAPSGSGPSGRTGP